LSTRWARVASSQSLTLVERAVLEVRIASQDCRCQEDQRQREAQVPPREFHGLSIVNFCADKEGLGAMAAWPRVWADSRRSEGPAGMAGIQSRLKQKRRANECMHTKRRIDKEKSGNTQEGDGSLLLGRCLGKRSLPVITAGP